MIDRPPALWLLWILAACRPLGTDEPSVSGSPIPTADANTPTNSNTDDPAATDAPTPPSDDPIDVLAGLRTTPVPDDHAQELLARYAPGSRLGPECSVSTLDAQTTMIAERRDDALLLSLIRGTERVGADSVTLPLPREGFFWKSWRPLSAASTTLGADVYAVTVRFEYWGGTGMGLLGSENDVVYLLEHDGERFELWLGAHVRGQEHDYTDCADEDDACMADAERHQSPAQRYRVTATTGDRPRFELHHEGDPQVSEWSPTTGRYEPPLLVVL